ncbi:hypothetical protein QB910_000039 [Dabrowskivirus KKP3916]|uniref:Uncharacterized protein n=1 Tax=Alicyclobacillus phage KKP_3916 TaxID=3040651 RepID=A0AAT9V7I7_9CAUD|nr:hypothetical protein QB910_000039 [Alicyclobacillus phage KKP 3916]
MSATGTLLTKNAMGMAGLGTLQAQTGGVPTPNGGASGNRFVILNRSGYMAYATLDTNKGYSLVLVPNAGSGTPQAPIPFPNMIGQDQSKYFLTMYADPTIDVIYVSVGYPSSLWVYKYQVNATLNSMTLINVINPLSNTNLGGASQAFQEVNLGNGLTIGLGISQLGVNGSYNTSYVLGYLYNPNIGSTEPMSMITPTNNIVTYQNIVTSLATVNNVFVVNGEVYLLWGNLEHSYSLYHITTDGTTISASLLQTFNMVNPQMYGDFNYQPLALDVTTDGSQYIWISKATKLNSGQYVLDIMKYDVIGNQVVWEVQPLTFQNAQVCYLSSILFDGSIYVVFETLNNDGGDIQYAKFDSGTGSLISQSTYLSSQDGTPSWSPKIGVVGNILYCSYVYGVQSNTFTPSNVYYVKLDESSQVSLQVRDISKTFSNVYLSAPVHIQSNSVSKSYSLASFSKQTAGLSALDIGRSSSVASMLIVTPQSSNGQGLVNVIDLQGKFVINVTMKGSA